MVLMMNMDRVTLIGYLMIIVMKDDVTDKVTDHNHLTSDRSGYNLVTISM